jgi:uncharacterized protein YecE (DUF72 family)
VIVRAGTSGFSYEEWKGSFYPDDLSKDSMLAFYADRLGTVEINNTYYRMPKASVLEDWAGKVADDFRFVLKANRRISHFKKLKGTAVDDMEYFWSQAVTLGDRLGPILIQLPGNFHKNADRLAGFLEAAPEGARAAVEFRHESWWDDEVYDTLRRHNAALVIAQTVEYTTPLVATADWGYLRLRKEGYEAGEVEEWADRVKDQSWGEAYVFFKHEDAGAGPRLAQQLMQAL